jgi:cob(I)alamin adenosyltransferase
VKIYTKTGDAGETGLYGGLRVSKADPRVDAYGDVDEANACLGVVRAAGVPGDIDAMLDCIQRDLFALGAQLADGRPDPRAHEGKTRLDEADVTRLEGWIDQLETELPPLKTFILAGGSPAGASLHLARTVCRRAERRMVTVPDVHAVQLVYVNRLSDLLFVIARVVNHRAGLPEVAW